MHLRLQVVHKRDHEKCTATPKFTDRRAPGVLDPVVHYNTHSPAPGKSDLSKTGPPGTCTVGTNRLPTQRKTTSIITIHDTLLVPRTH